MTRHDGRTGRSAILYSLGLGVPGIVNLATVAFHTRLLDLNEYGRYAIALTIAVLGQAVLFQWLGASLLRYTSAADAAGGGSRDRSVATTRRLAGLIIGAALASSACAATVAPSQKLFVFATGAYLCALGWYELNVALARSLNRPARFALLSLLRSLLTATLSTIAAWKFGTAAAVLLAGGGGFALATLAVAPAWRRRATFDGAEARRLFRFGAPLSLSTLLSAATAQLDRVFISTFISVTALGTYAAAQSVALQSVSLLIAGTAMATYPQFVAAFDGEDRSRAGRAYARQGLLLLGIGAPAAVGLAMLAPQITALLLGAEFRSGASQVLAAVALATLAAAIREYHYSRVFHGSEQTHVLVGLLATGALISVTLNALLTPQFGTEGALVALVASQGAMLLLVRARARRELRASQSRGDLARLACALVLMSICLLPFRYMEPSAGLLALAVAAGGSVYMTAAFLLNIGGLRRHLIDLVGSRA